jgi:hypothetical protein
MTSQAYLSELFSLDGRVAGVTEAVPVSGDRSLRPSRAGASFVVVARTRTALADILPADQNRHYVLKYTERIAAMFGTADKFAALFSTASVITPTRVGA